MQFPLSCTKHIIIFQALRKLKSGWDPEILKDKWLAKARRAKTFCQSVCAKACRAEAAGDGVQGKGCPFSLGRKFF